MKVVLVDDEIPALDAMRFLLNKYDAVEIVGAFTDPNQLLDEIEHLNPSVLFLDIEMREINGLIIAEKLYEIIPNLHIVFVTAYNEYAVSAFELNAVDYLLKPVSETRLEQTMQRITSEDMGKYRIALQEDQLSTTQKIVHVRCFGRFQVAIGDVHTSEIVKWRTTKSEELFALFIHHNGDALHKDFIIEQLWPGVVYENALVQLHSAIYQIRKMIKLLDSDAGLRFSRDYYQLFLFDLRSDVEAFKRLVKEADEATDERLIKLVNKAIELYRGHYVDENDYLWSMGESGRLAEQFTDLLMRATDCYMNRQQDKKAIPYLQRLIHQNPLNEGYYRLLFSIYAKLHDYTSLKGSYKNLSKVLKEELGEFPHSNTTAHFESLMGLKVAKKL